MNNAKPTIQSRTDTSTTFKRVIDLSLIFFFRNWNMIGCTIKHTNTTRILLYHNKGYLALTLPFILIYTILILSSLAC